MIFYIPEYKIAELYIVNPVLLFVIIFVKTPNNSYISPLFIINYLIHIYEKH